MMKVIAPLRVDVVFAEPIQCVIDEEASNAAAQRPIEVDSVAPRRTVAVSEVRPILPKIISLRAEMVVDDVQHDRETFTMARVDESLQPVGPAIHRMRRV